MPLSIVDAKAQVNIFFQQVSDALATAAQAELPLIGRVADLPAAAGVTSLFDTLKAQMLTALDHATGPDPAAAIATALNGLGLPGVTATATAGGSVAIAFAEEATISTGTATVDLSEAVGAFLGLSVDTGADCTAALACTLVLAPDGTAALAPQAAPEISLSVGADISLNEVAAKLGVADVSLSDADPDAPEIAAGITVDLTSGAAGIAIGETEISGAAGLDLLFEGEDIAGGLLPDVAGRLRVDFGLADGAFLPPSVGISDLKLDLGSYFGLLSDLFDDIGELFEATPVRQIVDILQAPIPGLNEIGQLFPSLFDKVGGLTGDGDGVTTVGDLAAYQSGAAEAVLDRWYGAIAVIEMITRLNALEGLGELELAGGTLEADGGITSLDNPEDIVAAVKDKLNDLGLPEEVTGFFDDWDLPDLPDGAKPDGALTFNLLENPADILKILLTDQPVDLISYDVPAVGFDVNAGGFFPVFGPLGFELTGLVAGSLDFAIGYDTQGLLDGTIANGLYLTTDDALPVPNPDTNPAGLAHLPVGRFDTEFGGGVGVGFLGSGLTIGGGFTFGLYGYFEAADSDGKFRPGQGLSCILDPVGGTSTANLSVKISLGFGPFSVSKKIVLAATTLADFTLFECPPPSIAATPTAPGLATALPAAVRLNVGADATHRKVVDNGDGQTETPVTPDDPQTLLTNESLIETYVVATARDADGTALPGRIDVMAFGFTQRLAVTGPIRGDFAAGDDVLVIQSDVMVAADVRGGAGEDLLTGGGAADTLRGGADADILNGAGGADRIFGEDGADQLSGGAGGDLLDGGAGFDMVDYSAANAGTGIGVTVTISLAGDSLGRGGEADGDRLRGIEMLVGSAYADDFRAGAKVSADLVFDGGAGDDILIGGLGDDLLIGGTGADLLNGDAGKDGITYVTSWGGVDVDLARERQFGGDAAGDRVFNVESLAGSTRADMLRGTNGANVIVGFEGADILEGRGGADEVDAGAGNDTVHALGDGDRLNGGQGSDVLSYAGARQAVQVDLGAGEGRGGFLTRDNIAFAVAPLISGQRGLSSFEVLIGSLYADTLTGDAADNRIFGLDGADAIRAEAGFDWIRGGLGADAIDGGTGEDWADYADSSTGVVADLIFGGAGGTAAGDSFAQVENLFGSTGADVLRGTEAANILDPNISRGRANEVVEGRGGADTLRVDYGSAGAEIGGRVTGYIDWPYANALTRYDAAGAVYDRVSIVGIERLDFRGTRGDDAVGGGSGDDILITGAGNDSIWTGVGADLTLAGDGDDFVGIGQGYASTFNWGGEVGPFLADGGAGIDRFSLSLRGTSTGLFLIVPDRPGEYTGTNLTFASGGAIRNFEGLENAYLGNGDDALTVQGRHDNQILTGNGSDFIAPGLGFDYVDGEGEIALSQLPYMRAHNKSGFYVVDKAGYFATGDRMTLDYSGLAAGASVSGSARTTETGANVTYRAYSGGDVTLYDFLSPISTNAGSYVARDASGTVTDRLDFADIESLYVTGSAGNDLLQGTQVPVGTDLFNGGTSRGRDTLFGGDGNDSLHGLTGSDLISGGAGNDYISGTVYNAVDRYGDTAEIDYLYGGRGADLFVGGTGAGEHYLGESSYGVVMDFNVAEGDVLQLTSTPGWRYEARVEFGSTMIYRAYGRSPIDADDRIMGLSGVTGFDLNAEYVRYVAKGSLPFSSELAVAAPLAHLAGGGGAAVRASAPAPQARIAAAEAEAASGFSVTQTSDPEALLARLLGGTGTGAGRLTLSGNAGAFGTFDDDPFGLGGGVILSTGEAADLPGVNQTEREDLLPTPIQLEFQQVATGNGNALYRADITGLDIRSLTLTDSNSRLGGNTGYASGFDIDAIVISRTLITYAASAAALNGGVLPRLDVFDFSNASLDFTAGTQRDPAGGSRPYGALNGTRNGLVDNGFARLDQFTDSGSGNDLSLGDGGSLGINLKAPLDTTQRTYLYVGEVGNSSLGEALTATVAGSSSRLEPEGDLSTDFGLPGPEDDGAGMTYSFTPDAGDTRFSFQAVLFTEELPERIEEGELADLISIRLNGREIGALSNGADLSIRSQVYSQSGDLVLNPPEDGPLADQIRADAYTRLLTISGAVDPGVENELTIEVRDGRDGYLDSGLLIREGSFRTLPAELLVINGTAGRDVLKGSGAAEEVNPRGGNDFVTLGDGADVIRFNDLVGKRDVLTIADFQVGEDELDLLGATVADISSNARQTVLHLDGPDGDMIVLLGLTHSPFDALT